MENKVRKPNRDGKQGVEDAEPGMRAAVAAGMKFVRVPSRKQKNSQDVK